MLRRHAIQTYVSLDHSSTQLGVPTHLGDPDRFPTQLEMSALHIYIYRYQREGLSIPAYFIPAHVDGDWSKILGCCRCCCSAAWDRTASRDMKDGIYQIIS